MNRRQMVLALCVIVLSLVVAFLVAFAPPARGATGGVSVGSQGWWDANGITVPSRVGQHIHVDTTIPLGAVDGTLNLPVKVTLHNQTGAVTWLRACRESSNCQTWKVTPLGPCSDCSRDYVLPINVGAWPSGKQELRLTANVPSNDDDKRQFQSTGWPIQVRSGTSCPRCSVFWTARGWYADGHNYANAELESDPTAIRSGATVKVYMHPGSDGKPTKFSGVYIDPDFHRGSSGIVVKQVAGQFRGSVTLPTLPSGPHRLVILSSDGNNAGVLTFGFTTP